MNDNTYTRFLRGSLDFDENYIEGLPVFDDSNWCLIKFVNDDLILIDGYSLFKKSDITEVIENPPGASFTMKALLLKGELESYNDYDSCTSMIEVLKARQEHNQLVVVYTEAIDNSVCEIGQLVSFNQDELRIKEVDSMGVFGRLISIPMRDITRIDFDGGYEKALSLVSGTHLA